MKHLSLLALLVLGCPPVVEEKEPPPIPKGGDTGDTAAECAGTNPVLTALSARPDGCHELEQGQLYPTLIFDLSATDADGDLNYVTYELWWDEEVDGAVDTSGNAQLTGHATVDTARCGTESMSLALSLSSQGNPAYNVWYDFALRVGDEAGLTSNVLVTPGAMPKEDCSDPDPMK
ncbi:MAG: hypothetical protein ABIO70_20325 [Pseudomonadota bacterium]